VYQIGQHRGGNAMGVVLDAVRGLKRKDFAGAETASLVAPVKMVLVHSVVMDALSFDEIALP
jgi:hypothetical protein